MKPICNVTSELSPVIIIAAARSGTKMLRELLSQSRVFREFPYDINYIWLYGNYSLGHDELLPSDLTPQTATFIRKEFARLSQKGTSSRVLEKSVPNSLRVSYVKSVFPKAQLVHLYRNGLDVTADAMQCWQSSLFSNRIQKKSDLIKKVISYPYVRSFPYLKNYLLTNISRLVTRDKHVRSWGPRYSGIDQDVAALSLVEVCARQWAKSVDVAVEQLASLDHGKDFINVKYEDLVLNTGKEVGRICDYIGVPDADKVINYSIANVSSDYIDFHKDNLDPEDLIRIQPLLEPSLTKLGYRGIV